ncbi:TniQ family protein [Kitasatospora purpeofusca]|uniref:TniQ family protein n=1 Tax=Kitasatospora purpeofusca TaxID=67352 RepID=UPI0035DCE2BD
MNSHDEGAQQTRPPLVTAAGPPWPRPLPRRLSSVPLPRPGESLLSWLDAVALDFDVSRDQAAQATGVIAVDAAPARLSLTSTRSPVFSLDDETTTRIEAATGLSVSEARNLTLSRFVGTALRTSSTRAVSSSGRGVAAEPWVDHTELRFCPECVAADDGRWPLAWSLPWVFCCLAHRRYLTTICSTCRMKVRPAEVSLARGVCGRAARERGADPALRCPGRFRDAEAPPLRDPELIRLQKLLLEHLQADSEASRDRARADFQDLSEIAVMALFLATPAHLDGADPVIHDAFSSFSRRYFVKHGRLMMERDRFHPGMLVLTGCLRVASQIVFADDPLQATLSLADLRKHPADPAVRPLRRSWITRPPVYSGERIRSIIEAVQENSKFSRGWPS